MKRLLLNIGIAFFLALHGLALLTAVIGGIASLFTSTDKESPWMTVFVSALLITISYFIFLKPARFLKRMRDENKSQVREPVAREEVKIINSDAAISIRFETNMSQTEYRSYENTSRPSGKPAKWYSKGESVIVQGYELSDGMIYVGESLPDSNGYSNDASLINPKLKALRADPWEGGEEMGYWSEYARIPNRCRGAYLQWLASGRSEAEAYIGYVFLFFYGLERRLLIDGQKGIVSAEERDDIVDEIKRLLKIYGERPTQNGESFKKYASNLLSAEWILYRSNTPVPDYIDLNDKYRAMPFKVLLAQQVISKRPIPSDMALRWVSLQENFWLRTPARRCVKEFEQLFTLKYSEKFGEGMIIEPNKTKLMFEYHPASPSIRLGQNIKIQDLPNPFILTAPVKKLIEIAEDSTDKLDSYSRYIGRKDNDPKSLAALALLPKELMSQSPLAGNIKAHLEKVCSSGPGLISVKTLYEVMEIQVPVQFSKKDAESLALLVEGMGFGLAPDNRFHNAKPTADDNVCIFQHGHGANFKPSKEFYTVNTILRLGAMVSQSDKDLAAVEDMMLKGLIQDNRELTNIEKDSLLAFLHWSLRTPQSTAGLKQQLTNVSSVEKTAISRILISIAHVDGRIDPREIKQIEKLYTSLGLDKDQVTNDIHTLATAYQPVTVARRDPDNSFSIPAAPVPTETKQGFQLNEELIRIRVEETRQVKGVLENIFADDSHEAEINIPALVSNLPTNPLHVLDDAHQRFFHRIVGQETWERSKLHEICKEMGLMMDGAMETLNEWAFDNVNAPLIDDGDPVYVDVNLAKEIVNV